VQSQTTTIIIADDHPLFRGALRQAVASSMPQARVVEASGMEDLNATLTQERDVDLILLDLTMPGVQGFSGLMSLRAQYPELPVVIVSATEEPTVIRRAMDFGASGFIPKSLGVRELIGAIRAVLAGGVSFPEPAPAPAPRDAALSLRQIEVLALLAEGLSNKQIARRLELAERTVKAHVTEVLQRLGVANRTHAVVEAARRGLVPVVSR